MTSFRTTKARLVTCKKAVSTSERGSPNFHANPGKHENGRSTCSACFSSLSYVTSAFVTMFFIPMYCEDYVY